MKQISLAMKLDPRGEPAITLRPEQRHELVQLMATAIVAVYRSSEQEEPEGDVDDDASEQ